ncbi:MAG: hypothetical protein FD126_810 [Elusimicrobia bacterium]|nr:MAG: hypothetical protein FD126_810 [Elusimicrobiota bacterium]
MNRRTETSLRTLLLSALALAFSFLAVPAPAQADPNPTNDTDTFTVRLSPNVDMGVIVDTSGAAWAGFANLDAVLAMNAESILGTGVKLTIVGDFNIQELTLSAAALDTWTLDSDETPTNDSLRLYGLIGADQAAAPSSALFNGAANLVTTSAVRVGQAQANEGGDTGHTYEFSTGQAPQYGDLDNMPVGAARRLWLRANTPLQSSTDEQQRFVLTVTAVSGAGL